MSLPTNAIVAIEQLLNGLAHQDEAFDTSDLRSVDYDGTPAVGVTVYSRLSRGQLAALSTAISALPAYIECHLLRKGNFMLLVFW